MKKICIAFLIALLPLSSLYAENGQFKDGPFIALPTGGDVENERLAGGWQAAYEFNDLFSIEATLAGQTDEIVAEVATSPLDAELELNILSFALTGRMGWFWDPVGFFVGGGAGYYYFDADAEESRIAVDGSRSSLPAGVQSLRLSSDIEDAIGWHLAVGAEWLLTGTWEMFVEYRHIFLETDARYKITETRSTSSGAIGNFSTSRTQTEEISYDHGLFRVGLNYRF